MTPVIVKYALDLTGKSTDNLVLNEPHDLSQNAGNDLRAFVLNNGSFYTRDLVVRNADGDRLEKNTDYIATYLYEAASKRTGLEVCGALVIKNPNVSSTVYVDYQCVGGDYAQNTDALNQVLAALDEDDQPVEWGNITGKPKDYRPGEHFHALWELYGFEYMVDELERITQAIMVGDQAAMDSIRDYAKSLYDDNLDRINDLEGRLDAHISDDRNPHSVTKAQVGLGDVENHPMATDNEARGLSTRNRYLNPGNVGAIMDAHNNSGDHDSRYVRKNAATETSIRVSGSQIQIYGNGSWRTVWPPQWQ